MPRIRCHGGAAFLCHCDINELLAQNLLYYKYLIYKIPQKDVIFDNYMIINS